MRDTFAHAPPTIAIAVVTGKARKVAVPSRLQPAGTCGPSGCSRQGTKKDIRNNTLNKLA
ncbi:hypothetical protein [Paenibacillus sp. PL91]|uniref:hypothetical protein n=1 Tax=Paenibacillus sp. PL91 TaxID=2729538 RepID=UPI00145C5C79|nr:hypothetical protein [Paenibacillus sp. PL91]MBC9199776.1 hypothetical protein [Paenibacillus sp. PL91]